MTTTLAAGERRPWRVWKAADRLAESDLLTCEGGQKRFGALADDIADILRGWGRRWAYEPKWSSFLDKGSLLHEVEEVLAALASFVEWAEAQRGTNPPVQAQAAELSAEANAKVTVLDLCAGKGVFSMVLSFLAARRPALRACVGRIVMVDRADINWYHVDAVNADVEHVHAAAASTSTSTSTGTHGSANGEPGSTPNLTTAGAAAPSSPTTADAAAATAGGEPAEPAVERAVVPIEVWGGVSVFDAAFDDRVRDLPGRLAFVGIHLCKALSPRAISLFNGMGAAKAPFLLLAPCCLPRPRHSPILVEHWEPAANRVARRRALAQRKNHPSRQICFVCGSKEHKCSNCPIWPKIPENEQQREKLIAETKAALPCIKCYQLGHLAVNCPFGRPPPPPPPPGLLIDVEQVRQSEDPFDAWVAALRTTVQAPDTPNVLYLPVTHKGKCGGCHDERNWNRDRKCAWLVSAR